MTPDMQRMMSEATRLTRAGDLQAAMAAIQSGLGGANAGPAAAMPDPAQWVIDVGARVMPDAAGTVPDAPPGSQAPAGEQFVTASFANESDRRDYKLYIPPHAGTRPMPLVVMLHGCTQTPDDFAAGTAMNEAARAQGFFVLYPAQSHKANPQRCWNWFKHSHQERGRGEPALLAGMAREVMSHHAIDPERIYVAGLSAGGAMAAILGVAYPELFAAVGVHSGLAAGAATDLPSALAAMRRGGKRPPGAPSAIPTIVFHGSADATVHPDNGDQVIAATAGVAAAAEQQPVQDGAGRRATQRIFRGADGNVIAEHWLVDGAAHAWSGGSAKGSYTDPRGPDATAEMLRFFFEHPRRTAH